MKQYITENTEPTTIIREIVKLECKIDNKRRKHMMTDNSCELCLVIKKPNEQRLCYGCDKIMKELDRLNHILSIQCPDSEELIETCKRTFKK